MSAFECWRMIVEAERFYYELLKHSQLKVVKLENNCLRNEGQQ